MTRRRFGYLPIVLLLLAAVAVAVFVHQRTHNIQQALAAEIFQQVRDIASIEHNLLKLDGKVMLALLGTKEEMPGRLEKQINDIRYNLDTMLDKQERYTFSALTGAAKASALVSPVLSDLSRWLDKGISDYAPMSMQVLGVMHLRLDECIEDLRVVNSEANAQASELLRQQGHQLSKFKRYVTIFLFGLIWTSCVLGIYVLMQRDRQARIACDRQRTIDAIGAVDDGFIQLDRQSNLLVHNVASETLCQQLVDNLKTGCGLLEALLLSAQQGALQLLDARVADGTNEIPSAIEIWTLEKRFIRVSQRSTDDGGQVILMTEITDLKNTQQQLREQASTDVLTRLPNRSLFHQRLEKLIQQARQGEYRLAIMLIDLDHFKEINDRLGHAAGDELLREMARRIRHSLGQDDESIGARMGGDEFAAILAKVDKPRAAKELGEQLLYNLRAPMELNGHEVMMSASIGIAVWPDHTEVANDMAGRTPGVYNEDHEISVLLNCADAACYQAKSRGRNRVELYNWQLRTELKDRTQMELQLHRAIENNEIRVVYQPQWNMLSGEICAIEALLEWHQEGGQCVSPEVFVPVAEQTGCIDRIGKMVLETACRDANTLFSEGLLPQGTKICVNIAPRQFILQDVPHMVMETLRVSGVSPNSLVLEITEGTFKGNAQKVAQQLKILGDAGVSMVIDGFGVGYSSLLRLLELPLDGLKIDQSFIRDLPITDIHNNLELSDPTKNAALEITKTIIAMAKSLRLEVIAVGVNSRDQAQLLRQNECMVIQGNYFCRPLALSDLKPYLKERKRPRVTNIRAIPSRGRLGRGGPTSSDPD